MGEHGRAIVNASDVKRIVVLELWNIGDVVLTLPFLQQLRTLFPNARIVLVARPHARQILGASGLVHEWIETNLGWQNSTTRWNPLAYPWRELWRLVGELRGGSFDIAFQCRPHVREYIILALSGARRRVGMSMKGWDRLLTDRVPIDVFTSQKKEAWLRLLDPFGGSRQLQPAKLQAEASARDRASRFLAARGVSTEDVLIGVHPGASVAEKRWPIDRFAEVVRELVRRGGTRVLVFVEPGGYGSALDAIDGGIIASLDLPEMVALLERCDLLVCNDSGPMHVAAALGVPCVAVFGSGIEQMFEPLGGGHHILTAGPVARPKRGQPSEGARHDVSRVPTAQVLDAIRHVLG
jgi:heptosyltransferase II